MKLHHASGLPNSRRVRMLIAEKGLDIALVPVDLSTREQLSDAYRAINPRAVVPALELDDGSVIAEAPVIMRYLDDAYSDVPLFGTTPEEKAVTAMWERRAELEGFIAVMEGVRNAAAGLKGRAISGPHGYEQIPDLVERSRPATDSRRPISPRSSPSTLRHGRSTCPYRRMPMPSGDGTRQSSPAAVPAHDLKRSDGDTVSVRPKPHMPRRCRGFRSSSSPA